MAKNSKMNNVKRQGRRVMPALRRQGVRAREVSKQATLTIGDLIAAAYDAVGGGVDDVANVLRSNELIAATGKKIVVI